MPENLIQKRAGEDMMEQRRSLTPAAMFGARFPVAP
jgi:hypothetical protein